MTTPEGAPMVGAHVQVVGQQGTVVVGNDGRFALEPEPQPPFDLLVTRADGVLIQPVHVDALPAEGMLELHAEAALTGSVTVLGEAPDVAVPPAAAFTVSGAGDLAQRNPQLLGEVLENLPGTSSIGTGLAAVPALRGLAKARTLILLDEGRVTAERRAGPSASYLDPGTVEEVEVIRGPGSVAYGSDAFGGVLRMRTRVPGVGEPTSLRYSLLGGSNDRLRAADVEVGTGVLGGGLLLGASWREADDYESAEAEVPNSGYETRGFRLGYQAAVGNGLLRLIWRTDQARDVGKPDTSSLTKPTYYPEENSHRATVGYEQPGPGSWSRLAVNLTWDEYGLITDKERLPTPSKTRQLTEADVFSHDYGLRLEAERPVGPGRLSLGLDSNGRVGLHATNRTTNYTTEDTPIPGPLEVSVDSARRDDIGVFAALDWPVGPVGLSTGLRLDHVRSKNVGGYFGDHSTSTTEPSGFVAATVPLARSLELSAQVSRGFRDALLSDRYYRGITARGSITGNPDLESETSRQYDLALRYRVGQLQLAGFGYLYRISNLIERYAVADEVFEFRNRGQAEVTGFELEGTWHFPSDLLLQLAVQRLRGEVLDDDSNLDDIPADGVVLTIRRDPSQRWWWLARAGAYARDKHPGPTEVERSGYGIVDGGVGYRVSDALELQLFGRNLLDKAFYASPDSASVLAPGRTIQLSLRGRM